jgi:hypothetical protein
MKHRKLRIAWSVGCVFAALMVGIMWVEHNQLRYWKTIPLSRGTCVVLFSGIGLFTLLSYVPWIPWRFTLRALLIAATLVAVGLGLIVWLR